MNLFIFKIVNISKSIGCKFIPPLCKRKDESRVKPLKTVMISTESLHAEHEGMTEAGMVPTVSAVAVSPSEPSPWCVAVVKRNSEKVVRDALLEEQLDAYVATQTLRVQYAKRHPQNVEYVRLPAKVFLHLSFKDAREQEHFRRQHPAITSFMPDFARRKDSHGRPVMALIPDSEMQRMRRWLEDDEHEVTFGYPDARYEVGGWARVVGTRFDGEQGRIARKDSGTYIILEVKGLSWATVRISQKNLVPLSL